MTETTDIKALRGEVPEITNLFDAGKFIAKVLDQLEAERQRADELESSNDRIRQRWVAEVSNNCDAGKRVNELEAELAALRGVQDPVVLTDDTVLDWGYRNDIKGDVSKLRCMIDDGASLGNYQTFRQPKPVVVLSDEPPVEILPKGSATDASIKRAGVITGWKACRKVIEAAGIVVKDGE